MDYLPPAISNTVGTSCIVVADVTPKALDTDDITFHVSSFEIINAPAPAAAVGGTSSLPTSGQQSAQLCTPAPAAAVGGTSSLPTSSEQSAQLKSPEDPQVCSKSLDATPTKGIIGSNDPESKEVDAKHSNFFWNLSQQQHLLYS
jgi:hypothetical protein